MYIFAPLRHETKHFQCVPKLMPNGCWYLTTISSSSQFACSSLLVFCYSRSLFVCTNRWRPYIFVRIIAHALYISSLCIFISSVYILFLRYRDVHEKKLFFIVHRMSIGYSLAAYAMWLLLLYAGIFIFVQKEWKTRYKMQWLQKCARCRRR